MRRVSKFFPNRLICVGETFFAGNLSKQFLFYLSFIILPKALESQGENNYVNAKKYILNI